MVMTEHSEGIYIYAIPQGHFTPENKSYRTNGVSTAEINQGHLEIRSVQQRYGYLQMCPIMNMSNRLLSVDLRTVGYYVIVTY